MRWSIRVGSPFHLLQLVLMNPLMNPQTYPVNIESVTGKKKHRLPARAKSGKACTPYLKTAWRAIA
jgi:hypothetical protein